MAIGTSPQSHVFLRSVGNSGGFNANHLELPNSMTRGRIDGKIYIYQIMYSYCELVLDP